MMYKMALIILGLTFATTSENHFWIKLLIITSLLYIMVSNKKDTNVFHLCLGFLFVKVIDTFIFASISIDSLDTLGYVWSNAIIFSIHLIIDSVSFVFVLFRPSISRTILLSKNKSIDDIYMYQSEIAFLTLFLVYIAVDLLAIIENFIRHLEVFGFNLEISEKFSKWGWMYHQYGEIKGTLTVLSFLCMWSMVSKFGKEEYAPTIP
ncbi:MAG: hypothetical protein ACI9LM_003706 [Alteromonadaceae bacterium]|jgi:hypothetical protein